MTDNKPKAIAFCSNTDCTLRERCMRGIEPHSTLRYIDRFEPIKDHLTGQEKCLYFLPKKGYML